MQNARGFGSLVQVARALTNAMHLVGGPGLTIGAAAADK